MLKNLFSFCSALEFTIVLSSDTKMADDFEKKPVDLASEYGHTHITKLLGKGAKKSGGLFKKKK